VNPATTIVAVRAAPVFGATEYVTCPSPVPETAPVSVIHEAFVEALHPQVDAVITAIVPVPPASGDEIDVGLTP
jgi:hypothetical protein